MSSQNGTIELQPIPPPAAVTASPKEQFPLQIQDANDDGLRLSQSSHSERAVEVVQRWNHPRINTWRLAAIFFAFIAFGMNDGSYGALLPYVHENRPSIAIVVYTRADLVDT